jgi:hypothetical protein
MVKLCYIFGDYTSHHPNVASDRDGHITLFKIRLLPCAGRAITDWKTDSLVTANSQLVAFGHSSLAPLSLTNPN